MGKGKERGSTQNVPSSGVRVQSAIGRGSGRVTGPNVGINSSKRSYATPPVTSQSKRQIVMRGMRVLYNEATIMTYDVHCLPISNMSLCENLLNFQID